MIWTPANFDPSNPYGENFPTLNAYPEPMALALALPGTHPWWRSPRAIARDVPGAVRGACIVRIDETGAWEPKNVRVLDVPAAVARLREEERDVFMVRLLDDASMRRAPRSKRSAEWELKIREKKMRSYPGRPPKAYQAFMMWKRLEDWALDAYISVRTLRRGLSEGKVLEDIIRDAWTDRGYM